MAKQTLYTVSSTEEFISNMSDKGWECIQLNDGSLGIGNWVLIAQDDRHYNFIIREVYYSAYSSAQTIRRCRKLSQKIQKEIERVEEEAC